MRIMTTDTPSTGVSTATKQSIRTASISFTDEFGQECLRVPLDRQGKHFAVVEADAYHRVRDAGATGAWLINKNGEGRPYVRTCVPTGVGSDTLAQVARLITGAGPRSVIRYSNGDTLDLRSHNLVWQRGKAKRTDTLLASNAKAVREARATA